MNKRPTQLAQLSPIPFVRLAPTTNEMTAHLLAYLLLLAGAFYLASGNPPAWARPLEPLASLQELFGQLLLPAAALLVFALLWEECRLFAARSPYKYEYEGRAIVLYPSPVAIIFTALSMATLLLPMAGAGAYYGLKSTFAGWANPGMARLATVLAALALLVLLALLLREMGQRWRQMQIQRAQGTRPAAHQIPARRSARPAPFFSTTRLLGPLLWLTLGAFLLAGAAYLARDNRWAALTVVLTLMLAYLACGRWARWRYAADSDSFILSRRHWFGWREVERLPAADFCGLYLERDKKGAYPQLWLVGRDGDDVRLARVAHWLLKNNPYWLYDNEMAADDLAEELSAASGLPLLYRWPAPPAAIFSQDK